MNYKTSIIAHRGFSSIAPENTMIAFEKAIEIGSDYIELDVRKSSDRTIMVIHDDSIDRTSGLFSGVVSKMSSSKLKKTLVNYPKKFGNEYQNQTIPTLQDVLELAKDKIKVCVEIKDKGIENRVEDIIHLLGMTKQVIVFSFDKETLKNIKTINPFLKTLFLADTINHEVILEAISIQADAVGGGSKTTNAKEILDLAHNSDLEFWRWTVDDEKEIVELISLGIDGLITNKPDLALKIRDKISKID